MDRGLSLVQTACQGIFIVVLTLFSLSWFLNKIKKYYTRSVTDISAVRVADAELDTLDSYKNKQDECRQRMQEEHESKASHQREKIRKQEEEKRHKKEAEFYKFSDPVYLSEGAVLGVIRLAEEPDISEEGVVSVMLRTPIGTVCQRRFYASDSIQCLLDYITTQGFSQRRYAVSTSYPRMLLDNPHASFLDYNFGRRVALNIEEKD